MDKVTIITKNGDVKSVFNVTYILYYGESKLVVVENGNIKHEFLVKDIATMDVE
jgi:hypothetical protein